jgi:hypothetical protein
MDWGCGREAAIAQLQKRVRETGSLVDRAIVREIKIASERFAETHAGWAEVVELVEKWEQGVPDIKILEAIRWINRIASGWKTAPRDRTGAQPPDHRNRSKWITPR